MTPTMWVVFVTVSSVNRKWLSWLYPPSDNLLGYANSSLVPNSQFGSTISPLPFWDIGQKQRSKYVSFVSMQVGPHHTHGRLVWVRETRTSPASHPTCVHQSLMVNRITSRCRTVLHDYNMSCDEVCLHKLTKWIGMYIRFLPLPAARKADPETQAHAWPVETRIKPMFVHVLYIILYMLIQ